MENDISHSVEQRFRNIEAHLGIGHTDEETGEYSADLHPSLVPPVPPEVAAAAPPQKSSAELRAELEQAEAREAQAQGV